MKIKAIAVVGALCAALLAGCEPSVSGTVFEKMYIPAFYDVRNNQHVPACYELVISGINGGNVCVSKSEYNRTEPGSHYG